MNLFEQKILETLIVDETSPTGLRWNNLASPKVRGKPAGTVAGEGYFQVGPRIDGVQKRFFAHRVVWFLENGCWPKDQIDHVNGNKKDNRISNLREASPAENSRNVGMLTRNTSGVKGVYFEKSTGKWGARIRFDRKQICVGMFDSIENAETAIRIKREQLHGKFANHGMDISSKLM